MASSNEVVFEFVANDGVSGTISQVSSGFGGLGIVAYSALQSIGTKATDVRDEIVGAASGAQQSWIAFSNSVKNVHGDLDTAKSHVKELANELERSVGDIRSFEMAAMNVGATLEQAELGAKAASAAAAGTDKEFSDVQSALTGALLGKARGIKQLGFDLDDYKDKTTGAIDATRLFNDIYEKYGDAQEEYAGSFAGNQQLFDNQIAKLKSGLGESAMDLENQFLPAVTQAVGGLNSMPEPLKMVAGLGVDLGANFASVSGDIADSYYAIEGLGSLAKNTGAGLGKLKDGALNAKDKITNLKDVAGKAKTSLSGFKDSISAAKTAVTQTIPRLAALVAGFVPTVVGALTASTSFTILGISISLATWQILLIVGAILAVIYVITHWDQVMGWINQAITWLGDLIGVDLHKALGDLGKKVTEAFGAFKKAVDACLQPLKDAYKYICDIGKQAGGWVMDIITGKKSDKPKAKSGDIIDTTATGKYTINNQPQAVQFNIDSVDVSANNLSPEEAQNVMITALEKLNNVENVQLKRRVV